MSNEPPRVNFPGASAPVRNSAGGSSSSYGRRPNGNPSRVVAIVLGCLFLFIFLCAGGAFVTYRRFNADSNFGGKFKDLREPLGGAIPDKTRVVVQSAPATESDEADQINNWLENEFVEVDTSRMVMEMQRSGLSNLAVNPLTRSLWKYTLEDAVDSPNFEDQVVVMDFEWLVDGKEARAIVASFSIYDDDCNVRMLYLSRNAEQWKLFDWRDVLLPMSEAQFWAVYTGLDEPQDETYGDFIKAADNILINGATVPDKIKQTMDAYNRIKFPRRYIAMAQNALCTRLVLYEAKKELAEVVKQLSPDEFAGVWLFKAQSAAWSDDIERAFENLRELTKQVGWHPKVGRLAAKIATTPEQKRLAAEWLQREVQLRPNYSVLNSYFKLADREQVNSLFQSIANTKRPSAKAISLVRSFAGLKEPQLEFLKQIVQPIAELQEATEYLDFQLAIVNKDFEKVLNLAPQVLQLESLTDPNHPDNDVSLYGDYLTAAAEANSLMRAFEQSPDRDEFLNQLRNEAAFWYSALPPKDTATILKAIPKDHELYHDVQTRIAIVQMDNRQANAVEAFDLAKTLYIECKSEIVSDEPMPLAYPLLTNLGSAAVKSERWRELIEVFQPEELLLLLAWTVEITPNQLNELLEWYERTPDHMACWSKYFRAQAAFEGGDWPASDQLMVDAIQFAKKDSRITEDSLTPLVQILLNHHENYGYGLYGFDLIAHWEMLRISNATRSDELVTLIAQAQVADKLNTEWIERIATNYAHASIESREKLVSILNSSQLPEAQALAKDIQADLMAARGQFNEAFENQVTRAKDLERGSFDQRIALMKAGLQLLLSGDKRRTDTFRRASRGTEAEAYADCIIATLDRDIPALCEALKRWALVEGNYEGFIDINVLNRLQGVAGLRDASVVQPLVMQEFRYSGETYLIVLSVDTDVAVKALTDFLKSKNLTFNMLEASRFHQATAALEIQTNNGDFVFTFSPANVETLVKNSSTDTFSKDARTFMLCTPKNTGSGQYAAKQLAGRMVINSVLDGLSDAIALYNSGSLSLFFGEGWQQRFSQSLQSGIDPAHPKYCHEFFVAKDGPGVIERDGQAFVLLGASSELIPIKLQPQASPWLDEVGVTLAPSILIPCLPADIMVKIDR